MISHEGNGSVAVLVVFNFFFNIKLIIVRYNSVHCFTASVGMQTAPGPNFELCRLYPDDIKIFLNKNQSLAEFDLSTLVSC